MSNDQLMLLGFLGLAALSVGLIVYVTVLPYLSGEKKADKRREDVAQRSTRSGSRKPAHEEINYRRKQVQDTIKELEAKQKAKSKLTMRARLIQAGLSVTPKTFYIASTIFAMGVGVSIFFSGAPPYVAAGLAFAAALGVPRWAVGFLAKRRQKKFVANFANAIDVVVRGVKSGLPLNECLGVIATESPEPIRSEFADLIEQQRVGVPLSEAFDRMLERMPLPEVNFFAIVIAIQQQAGGNLAEALGNLSGVLRGRTQLTAKVKALSAEANTSAIILGALPIVVVTMVYFTSPEYIEILWKDKMGHVFLAGAGFWMTCGIIVMRKMINFKY